MESPLSRLELPRGRARRWALLALGAFFFVAGAKHFVAPDFHTATRPEAGAARADGT